jgi:hypothetical protein
VSIKSRQRQRAPAPGTPWGPSRRKRDSLSFEFTQPRAFLLPSLASTPTIDAYHNAALTLCCSCYIQSTRGCLASQAFALARSDCLVFTVQKHYKNATRVVSLWCLAASLVAPLVAWAPSLGAPRGCRRPPDRIQMIGCAARALASVSRAVESPSEGSKRRAIAP